VARPTRFELATPKIRSKNKRQFLFYINPQPLNADAFEDQMFFLASMAIVSSPMIVAATAGRASPGTATTCGAES
jgi:hypothetical protein